MNKLIAAVAFATVIAAPAFAQSFDPTVGSGNIARQVTGDDGLSAYAQQLPMPMGRRGPTHAVQPFTAAEKALFNRIPIE
jgi:hypothetical protein